MNKKKLSFVVLFIAVIVLGCYFGHLWNNQVKQIFMDPKEKWVTTEPKTKTIKRVDEFRIGNISIYELENMRGKLNSGHNRSPVFAILDHDYDKMRNMLQEGLSPNYIESELELSLLELAIGLNDLEMLKILLEAGASPYLVTPNYPQSIWAMARYCSPEVRAVMFQYNASANCVIDEFPLLIQAIVKGDAAFVEQLLANNANPNSCFRNNKSDDHLRYNATSALQMAVRQGDSNIIAMLLAAGADVHYRNEAGLSALDIAVRKINEPAVKELLSAGANINSESIKIMLVSEDYEDLKEKSIVSLLAKFDFDFNYAINDVTPLMFILRNIEDDDIALEICKILFTSGAKLDYVTENGYSLSNLKQYTNSQLYANYPFRTKKREQYIYDLIRD